MSKEKKEIKDSQVIGLFVGIFVHSLDPKKRITVPAQWREQAGCPSVLVMPDFHYKCLNIYPAVEMNRRLERLRRHSLSDRKAMEFSVILGASSELVSWDVQGRIRIRDSLLNFAEIKSQVVLIGAMDKIQLWAYEKCPHIELIDQEKLKEISRYVDF